MSERRLFELLCVCHQAQEFVILHVFVELIIEFFHCRIFEIIATGDKAEFTWHNESLAILSLVRLNAAWIFKFFEYFFDSSVQKLLYLIVFVAWHIVKVGIFKNSSEQKAPGYPLNATLDIVDLTSSDLGINMVWYLLKKAWLDRKWVV